VKTLLAQSNDNAQLPDDFMWYDHMGWVRNIGIFVLGRAGRQRLLHIYRVTPVPEKHRDDVYAGRCVVNREEISLCRRSNVPMLWHELQSYHIGDPRFQICPRCHRKYIRESFSRTVPRLALRKPSDAALEKEER